MAGKCIIRIPELTWSDAIDVYSRAEYYGVSIFMSNVHVQYLELGKNIIPKTFEINFVLKGESEKNIKGSFVFGSKKNGFNVISDLIMVARILNLHNILPMHILKVLYFDKNLSPKGYNSAVSANSFFGEGLSEKIQIELKDIIDREFYSLGQKFKDGVHNPDPFIV